MQATLEKILFGLIGIIAAGAGIYIFNATHSGWLRVFLLALLIPIGYYLMAGAPGGSKAKTPAPNTGAHRVISPLAWGVIIVLGLGVAFIVLNLAYIFIFNYGDF